MRSTPCEFGLRRCDNGVWSECEDEVLPEIEICDMVDNDCNGTIDDSTVEEFMICGPATDTWVNVLTEVINVLMANSIALTPPTLKMKYAIT